MTNELRTYLTEQVNALKNAPSCCAEAKAVCEEWLAAAGTENEEAATKSCLPKLKQTLCLLTV